MDGHAVGLGCAVFGLPYLMLMPGFGFGVFAIGALATVHGWRQQRG